MTTLHKRGPEGTLQSRVFRALRIHSGSAVLIADAIGHQRESTRKAIAYLIRRGHVRKHVVSARLVIYAAVPRRHEPDDRRGKPATCRNHRGAAAFAKWLTKMMPAKHGPAWRYVPRNGHPLDGWKRA
jgi:hypothetical protein